MFTDVLIGLQWGDEGKGKIVDYLAPQYDIVARFQGGPNAGHTLKWGDTTFVLHTIPSGVFREEVMNIIGNGVVIDPKTFKKEIAGLDNIGVDIRKRLLISHKAHLILPSHKLLDAASEQKKGKEKIGSTLRGIGPTYMDKTGRNGLRVGDILFADFEERVRFLKEKHLGILEQSGFEFSVDAEEEAAWWDGIETLRKLQVSNVEYYINNALKQDKKVLAEGAQGAMLDIDFGTYPFVTSSNTISSSACTGLGLAPNKIKEVIGISKAYCTRVGSGPFPTELDNEMGELLRKEGHEFGATTGRPRRCGWLDLPALNYAIMLSGVTQLVITKIDVLNILDQVEVCHAYKVDGKESPMVPFDLCRSEVEPLLTSFKGWKQNLNSCNEFDELPEAAKTLINYIEEQTGVPVSIISNGPKRDELILKNSVAAL